MLVCEEYQYKNYANDEWGENPRRVPREPDATPSQSKERKRCSCNDHEVSTDYAPESTFNETGNVDSPYIQSTRASLSLTDPSGVRTRKKTATSTKDIPANGKFKSKRCIVINMKHEELRRTHRIAIAKMHLVREIPPHDDNLSIRVALLIQEERTIEGPTAPASAHTRMRIP